MHKYDYFTNEIIKNIENYEKINFLDFRDILYNTLIYHLDIHTLLYKIIDYFVYNEKLHIDNLETIYKKLYIFLKRYNNNYRPIYHLENFIYYLCTVIHGL